MSTTLRIENLTAIPKVGISRAKSIAFNRTQHELVQAAVRKGEGDLSSGGALLVYTGIHTGRSPKDKFVVRDDETSGRVWWGDVNHPMDPDRFDALHKRMLAFLQGKELFVVDAAAGADDQYRVPVRVITQHAWHALFAQTMFLPGRASDDLDGPAAFTILHAPDFAADPAIDGTRSDVFVAIDLHRRLVLIGGSQYAGEIKKTIFTVANYLLPERGVLSMHCSANEGPNGDVALFFGLSGTGKTTLSADPERSLIGDDEHGWGDNGIFNIEGGCYAKVINLSAVAEPEIFATTHTFGTVLENVVTNPESGELDLDDQSITENTRAAYPIGMIPGAKLDGLGGHPQNIILLTADAFGVLPPVARLTVEQAMYHFLSGYTAKVAGTEKGVTDPEATFSACFGSPFLPLPPASYADLLGKRITAHGSRVWLVNTGWTGGPYGVGHRMPIAATRAIIRAILGGVLDDVPVTTESRFGLVVPTACPGVDRALLDPRSTWSDGAAFDRQADRLARMFAENFEQFAPLVTPGVRAAGPALG